jgi:hypothetical protein
VRFVHEGRLVGLAAAGDPLVPLIGFARGL